MKTIEILERLIACPTVSADSNLVLIDWVETFLRDRRFGNIPPARRDRPQGRAVRHARPARPPRRDALGT